MDLVRLPQVVKKDSIATGPPAVTPREDDAEEDSASPKDESPRESRRKPMSAWGDEGR